MIPPANIVEFKENKLEIVPRILLKIFRKISNNSFKNDNYVKTWNAPGFPKNMSSGIQSKIIDE